MKTEDLHVILSEILGEIKEIKRDQKFLQPVLENIHIKLNEFEEGLASIEIEPKDIDFSGLINVIRNHHSDLKRIISEQPKEVIQEKRILFYPEGKGTAFLEMILKRMILYLYVIIAIYILGNQISKYSIENSENKKYKIAYEWIYINQKEKNQKYLQKELLLIQNDSIKKIRVDEIKAYFKGNKK